MRTLPVDNVTLPTSLATLATSTSSADISQISSSALTSADFPSAHERRAFDLLMRPRSSTFPLTDELVIRTAVHALSTLLVVIHSNDPNDEDRDIARVVANTHRAASLAQSARDEQRRALRTGGSRQNVQVYGFQRSAERARSPAPDIGNASASASRFVNQSRSGITGSRFEAMSELEGLHEAMARGRAHPSGTTAREMNSSLRETVERLTARAVSSTSGLQSIFSMNPTHIRDIHQIIWNVLGNTVTLRENMYQSTALFVDLLQQFGLALPLPFPPNLSMSGLIAHLETHIESFGTDLRRALQASASPGVTVSFLRSAVPISIRDGWLDRGTSTREELDLMVAQNGLQAEEVEEEEGYPRANQPSILRDSMSDSMTRIRAILGGTSAEVEDLGEGGRPLSSHTRAIRQQLRNDVDVLDSFADLTSDSDDDDFQMNIEFEDDNALLGPATTTWTSLTPRPISDGTTTWTRLTPQPVTSASTVADFTRLPRPRRDSSPMIEISLRRYSAQIGSVISRSNSEGEGFEEESERMRREGRTHNAGETVSADSMSRIVAQMRSAAVHSNSATPESGGSSSSTSPPVPTPLLPTDSRFSTAPSSITPSRQGTLSPSTSTMICPPIPAVDAIPVETSASIAEAAAAIAEYPQRQIRGYPTRRVQGGSAAMVL